jgi:dienelactone hydrolase
MTDQQQASRRQELYSLLGDLPPRDRPIAVLKNDAQRTTRYEIEHLLLDLNGMENVPAYLVKPFNTDKPVPAVLVNHWHGGQYELGKEGLIRGHRASTLPPYAEELTRLGYAALCIDHWAFGQRSTRSELDLFKDMLWHGRVMWGMMVYDSLRAVDYLATRKDIDARHLATLGMSMGSTMAWWLAALDQRIKVCIDICCLTDFQALLEADNLKGHGVYYYVPGLLNHFTTAQINELIVPRAHLALAGNLDPLTPVRGLDRIDAAMQKAYSDAGLPERWQLYRQDVSHVETAEMRQQIVTFLQREFDSES